jgi:hypothetical protein
VTHTVHLQLRIPRLLWDHWGGSAQVQAALTQAGLWPTAPVQFHRWRVDHVGMGYMVDLEVSIEEGTL